MAVFSYSSSSTSSSLFSSSFVSPVTPTSFCFGSNPSNPSGSFTISAPLFTPEPSPSPTSSPPMVFGAASAANFSSSVQPTDSTAIMNAPPLFKQVSVPSNEVVAEDGKSKAPPLETKTGENNSDSKVVDPIINAIRNSGLNKSLNDLGTEEAKDESANVPTETTVKTDKFSYTRILKGITHDPHFTPLQSYSKRSRERLIVGWDEIFEEIIDQIQSLTAETFSANVHDLWKTIAELENLGYDVARLRKRLDELKDVMNKRNLSKAYILDLKAKVDDNRKEKKQIESDIVDLLAQAEKAQVIVDELIDQVDKMESNLPVVDALFENIAKNPL